MHVAHLFQGLCAQRGSSGCLAVTHDVHVAAFKRRIIAELELQQSAGNVYGTRYMTCPVLIRITHIQQQVRVLDGIVRLIANGQELAVIAVGRDAESLEAEVRFRDIR